MKGFHSFIAQALIVGSLALPAVAGRIDPVLSGQLRQSSGDSVRVIVTLKNLPRHDVSALVRRGAKANRAEIVSHIQQNASESQADCLAFLQGRLGARAAIRSLWINNSLCVDADRALIESLAARADVDTVYLDETVELERVRQESIPRREQQALDAGPRAPGDTAEFTYGLVKVKVPELRQVYNLTGEGVKVGLIDTGCDAAHPDLAGKVVAWKDFVNNKPDPYDDQGHGTHCAGTIAGGSTSGLSIGVAPNAKIMAAKVFTSSGTAATEHILAAMQWIADPDGNPATNDQPVICSNSWGGGPGRKVFLEATKKWLQVGVFPSFAAGNSGPGAGTVGTPGGFLESFGVGATDNNDAIADFSSRGPVTWDDKQYTKPDISAPGKSVTSAKAGGGYTALSGTSMATPHISGILALLYQANPSMSIDQARELLERTSEDKGEPGKDNTFGAGRANALAAAQILISGGKVTGKLTDAASGAGIGGVINVAENGFSVKTDKTTGAFMMILPAGTYNISARAFGYTEQAAVAIELGAQQQHNMEIKLERAPGGTLSGKVVSAETGELLAAKVTVLDTPLDPVSTQSPGEFSVDLPAGNYKLLVTAMGYDPLTVEGVNVAAGQPTAAEFKLTHLPPVLIVADDSSKNYEKFAKEALDGLGKKYSVVSAAMAAGSLNSKFLSQYQVVIWMTGDAYSDTLTATDQDALKAFVNSGGGLFVTGQDVGYDIKSTKFYSQVLHAKWVADSVSTKDVTGGGLAFKIEGGTGANNQRYSDKVQGLDGATSLFLYGADQGPAGLASKYGNGRVVYFAFGYEAIDSVENRKAVAQAVLTYLTPTTAERAARVRLVASLGGAAVETQARTLASDVSSMTADELGGLKTAIDIGASVPRDVRRALNQRLMDAR